MSSTKNPNPEIHGNVSEIFGEQRDSLAPCHLPNARLNEHLAPTMPNSPESVAKALLSSLGLQLMSITPLQSLWAGYGSICALTARAETNEAASAIMKQLHGKQHSATKGTDIYLILKHVSSPPGRQGDEGHLRKMLSYEAEQHFYARLAPRLSEKARVARCLISTEQHSDLPAGDIGLILEDLRMSFPVAGGKRASLEPSQVHAAIDWLGNFHRESKLWREAGDEERFILPPLEETERRSHGGKGDKVWRNGGYTYLATRRTEYTALAEDIASEWSKSFCEPVRDLGSSIGEAVARVLTPRGRSCETYIHGDVKSENLFASETGTQVAFFDFQYVGLGLGVCDLAKLFTCSVPAHMLDTPAERSMPACQGERELLAKYRRVFLGQEIMQAAYPEEEFQRHWECALVDWCRFQASWGFWGNTEWLESRVRWILQDDGWNQWLREEFERYRIEESGSVSGQE